MFSDEGFQIVSGFDAYVHHVDPSAMVRVLRSEKSMVAGQEYVQPPASFNPLQRIMEVVVRFRFGASLSHPPLPPPQSLRSLFRSPGHPPCQSLREGSGSRNREKMLRLSSP